MSLRRLDNFVTSPGRSHLGTNLNAEIHSTRAANFCRPALAATTLRSLSNWPNLVSSDNTDLVRHTKSVTQTAQCCYEDTTSGGEGDSLATLDDRNQYVIKPLAAFAGLAADMLYSDMANASRIFRDFGRCFRNIYSPNRQIYEPEREPWNDQQPWL